MNPKSKVPMPKSKNQQSMSKSSKSITSLESMDDFSEGDESVGSKQSKASVKSVEKKVIFRTPILLGNHWMQQEFSSQQIKYRTGVPLNEQEIPAVVQKLQVPTYLIDLPLTQIDLYLRLHHSWLTLRND